jgi:hypothetical protein
MTPQGQRRTDKLLTFDRALLVGAFTVGSFVAMLEFKNHDIATKVEAIERRVTIGESRLGSHDIVDAEIKADVRWIRENLSKLAESTAKFVNIVRDTNSDVRQSSPTVAKPQQDSQP